MSGRKNRITVSCTQNGDSLEIVKRSNENFITLMADDGFRGSSVNISKEDAITVRDFLIKILAM